MPKNPRHREFLDQLAITVRTARRARRWTQRRLASVVGSSQSWIAKLERARLADVGLTDAARVLEAVGARMEIRFLAPITAAPTQRDRAHARCVGYVARRLGRAGWEVATEVPVEAGAGRWLGFIDVLAFHPHARILLVIEVKSEIGDLGEIDRQLGVGERGAWAAARARGWRPRAVLPTLLVLATRESDRRLADNRRYLDQRMPIRARQLQSLVDDGELRPTARGPTERGRADLGRAEVGGSAMAMIDPRSRRRAWLQATWIDGRRTPARYESRATYLAAGVEAALL